MHDVGHAGVQRRVVRIGRRWLPIDELPRGQAPVRPASERIIMVGLGTFATGRYRPLEITGLVGSGRAAATTRPSRPGDEAAGGNVAAVDGRESLALLQVRSTCRSDRGAA